MAQTILVVEDEDTLRDELSYQLEQEGYSVVQRRGRRRGTRRGSGAASRT